MTASNGQNDNKGTIELVSWRDIALKSRTYDGIEVDIERFMSNPHCPGKAMWKHFSLLFRTMEKVG